MPCRNAPSAPPDRQLGGTNHAFGPGATPWHRYRVRVLRGRHIGMNSAESRDRLNRRYEPCLELPFCQYHLDAEVRARRAGASQDVRRKLCRAVPIGIQQNSRCGHHRRREPTPGVHIAPARPPSRCAGEAHESASRRPAGRAGTPPSQCVESIRGRLPPPRRLRQWPRSSPTITPRHGRGSTALVTRVPDRASIGPSEAARRR